jgi:predicted transcriptional regulator
MREEFIILIPRRDTGANLDSNLDSSLDSNLVSKIVGDLISREIVKETALRLSHLSVIQSKRKDVLGAIGVTNQSFNAKRFIDPLLEMNLIKRSEGVSVSLQSPNLKYQITSKGKEGVSLQSPNLKYQITSKGKYFLKCLDKHNKY